MGLLLVWLFQPSIQSIVPRDNIYWHPSPDTELEGTGAKNVRVTVTTVDIDHPDCMIKQLSFYVYKTSNPDPVTETFYGTSNSVSGSFTVPSNGDYRIKLTIQLYWYDEGGYTTNEIHESTFSVFDPDYAGAEDQTFYEGQTTTVSPTGVAMPPSAGFEAPFSLLASVIGLITVYLMRRQRNG